MKASSDGTSLAVASEPGQLGVLNFGSGEAMPIFTHDIGEGFNWSPDGRTLLFVERISGQPSQILQAQAKGDSSTTPLVSGLEWKADPNWNKPGQLLYRSDWNAVSIRAVALDSGTTTPAVLIETSGDVAALWPSPLPGEFIYAVAESNGYSLYWRGAVQGEILKLYGDSSLPLPGAFEVSFSPRGTHVAFLRQGPLGSQVVIYDLDLRRESAVLDRESRPTALAMLADDDVILGDRGGLIDWRPDRKWSRDVSAPVDWNGIELTLPVRLADRGVAGVIGGDLIVTAQDVRNLPTGKIHTSRIEDLLDLSVRLQSLGRSRDASRMMDQLWSEYRETPQTNLLVASTRAVMETITPQRHPVDEWLDRTIELSTPEGSEFVSAWHARLIQAWFVEGDAKKTRELLRAIPARVADYPLVDWLRDSMTLSDEKTARQWRDVIRGLARNDWELVSETVLKLVTADAQSDFNRRGVALLVRGEFEPLADMMLADQLSYPELMKRREFQEAVVRLAGADLSADLSKGDFRGMLLLQWAKSGEFEAARNLVMVDLSDPSGSSLDYDDILSRYLIAEEQDAWMARAVEEIFLSKRISYLLQRHMNVTTSHLTFSLARAKNALVRGDTAALDVTLDQLDNDMLIIPADFWKSDNAFYLFLVRLYRAKSHELAGRWPDAMNSYSQAEQIVERFPSDWEIIALDLGMSKALLQSAEKAGGKEIEDYLAALRTLGDPLVSPTHETAGIERALARMRELERKPPVDWLKPFVAYGKGLCLQLLNRPYEAIVNFRQAREFNLPPDLRARVLFEEAAARSVLTQSRLAAGLLSQLCAMPLKPSQLVVGIHALAQAEADAGLIGSQEERLRQLCRDREIPWFWTETLIDAPPPEPENPPAEPAIEPQG